MTVHSAASRRPVGLGDVVRRAEFEAFLLGRDRVESGDEDDGDVARCRVLAQTGQHRVAVHFRHLHVEQDQVRPRRACGNLQGTLARRRGEDVVVRAQQIAEDRQISRIVIHDQYGVDGIADAFWNEWKPKAACPSVGYLVGG